MKTPLNPKTLCLIGMLIGLNLIVSGCATSGERDTLPPPAQAHSEAYNYAYWATTTAYNALALIAPSKADWAKKVDVIAKDAAPYLDRAKKGEITIEAALNLIAGAFPNASHWTSLVQTWSKLIASYGIGAFDGIADATDQYLAGDPLK